LKLENVKFDEMALNVKQSKTGNEVSIPITSALAGMMRRHFDNRKPGDDYVLAPTP